MSGKLKARIYLEKLESELFLSKEHSHYLMNVLRSEKGDSVALFNADQGEWRYEIEDSKHKQARIVQKEQLKEAVQKSDHLWLAFAPMKKHRLVFLAEKITELGVDQVFPIITDYTDQHKIPEDRFIANMVEAAEQSERLSVPHFHSIQKLDQFLKTFPKDRLLLVCAETSANQTIFDLLSAPHFNSQNIAILVGPPGGFSEVEFKKLADFSSARLVSLGHNILRAETAAVAAISCWQAIKGTWR